MTPEQKSKVLNDVLDAEIFCVMTPDSLHYAATRDELTALLGAAMDADPFLAKAFELTWKIYVDSKIQMQ